MHKLTLTFALILCLVIGGSVSAANQFKNHRIRTYVRTYHPCLARIIEGGRGIVGENRNYDPTLDYGGGHGNVHEPYGIPQANPGTKMRTAGRDWRTNPYTQVRWMTRYAKGRYGSDCGALNHKIKYGWY